MSRGNAYAERSYPGCTVWPVMAAMPCVRHRSAHGSPLRQSRTPGRLPTLADAAAENAQQYLRSVLDKSPFTQYRPI